MANIIAKIRLPYYTTFSKIFLLKKTGFIILILPVLLIGNTTVVDPPQVEITNGIIHALLYLPDAENGYYRGSRFDWSGIVSNLDYRGHTFYGQWFPKYNPRLHEAVMGPVEDFLPVGFDETNTEKSFLKIGIGVLSKADTSRYSIVTPYEIINPGIWKIKKEANTIKFLQMLSDTLYSYRYIKTITLIQGKPEMVIDHSLKNTGKRTIETSVYNHNFFMLDQQITGPGFTITFPFNLTSEGGKPELAGIAGNRIIFNKELAKNEHVYYTSLTGYSDSVKDYDIKVENEASGAGARITSDRPLSKLAFWSASTTVCPEPYIHIKINPGESFSWKIFYNYYSLK